MKYIPITEAGFPQPFPSELEFNAPTRGTWNIVHTGMILPESHQIFVCAQGCLRGVILTAAEMNLMHRMSYVAITEQDLFTGNLEGNIIEGVTEVLEKMSTLPRCALVFLSCIQLFAGCDVEMVFAELSQRFPEVCFIDCYMTPTMRKSGLTPDQLTRKQLYLPLQANGKENPQAINIIGNDRLIAPSCEMFKYLNDNGFEVRDINLYQSFDEFLQMSESAVELTTYAPAEAAGVHLAKRLNKKHLHLSNTYNIAEIELNYKKLAEVLNIAEPDFSAEKSAALSALTEARKLIGNTPIDIDYTAAPRPLSLAQLLTENGFTVRDLYLDVMIPIEKENFLWLQKFAPHIRIAPTLHPAMRFTFRQAQKSAPAEKSLAIGQKAAYFNNNPYFVDIVAGGHGFGYDGIRQMAELMQEAFLHTKELEKVIRHKGWGCESCL